jgi:hypothetical protein
MRRIALCVGINDYPGAGDLSGCINDAMDWSQVLQSRGYTVTTLLDSSATKARIVAELLGIVDSMKYRDRFVFCYSGHGTWVPDGDGDEPDGRDEALCCHDYASGGLLIDDEMHTIFGRARHGTQITVLSDSCHSGTVARGIMASAPPPGKPKFISPGLIPSVPVSVEAAIAAERTFIRATSRSGPVLISGCDDPEYSYDASFGNRPNGAFTRAAIDALGPDVKTFREWYRRIRLALPSPSYPQTPQFGATLYQAFRSPLD